MWKQAADQIESIHAMMSTGHRSVRMEPHTLVLWGAAGALLILTIRYLLPPERFGAHWQQIVTANALNIIVLTTVAVWDMHLTRRKREARDETLSFVQVQLTKVWWSVIGLIVLINIGMNVFGGGYLFHPILLSLLGLAFYIYGLFSQQLLAGAGIIMLLLGLLSAALRLPMLAQEWLSVMVLGVGLPALAWLIYQPRFNRSWAFRSLGFGIWLMLILIPALAVDAWQRDVTAPATRPVLLDDYRQGPATQAAGQVVRLPAGTIVPLEVTVTGSVLEGENTASVPLQLSERIDIMVEGNEPTGRFRVGEGPWKDRRNHYRIRDFKLSPKITREDGPRITLRLFISTDN